MNMLPRTVLPAQTIRALGKEVVQHVWTPVVTQEESSGEVERVGECYHVYGLICGHSPAAGPDEVRGSGPIQGGALEAPCCTLVFLIPSHRPLRHPSPSTFLRLQRPHSRARLHARGRSSIDPTPGHQAPDDTRHLVSQRYPHQHRRLAGQHARHPRAGRGSVANRPA